MNDHSLAEILAQIDDLRAKLLAQERSELEEEQLRRQLTVEAIYHANHIEGNQLTLPEVRAIVEAFWAEYPTRRDRSLKLKTDPHTYDQPGTYNILVKVIDIFGIDTSQLFAVEVT